MSQPAPGTLKKTPLNARHRSLGAKMVEFGGWDMPVEYSGLADEHMAVRTRAGLFDVSHMGEIEIAGKDALKAVQHITSNDAGKLANNQIQYSALTTPQGTFVDDVLTYKLSDEHFMLVVNASNIIKDFNWISEQIKGIGDAAAVNTSSRYALMALQGPGCARGAADADGRQPLRREVLLVHDRRSRVGDVHHLADGLHRRGRLRSLRPAEPGRARVGRDPEGGQVRRCDPRRAWRTRHAAPRGRDAPLRQRHGRNDDRRRSRPRMDRRVEEGGVPRLATCCGSRRPKGRHASSSASR